jgi:hypothetical protein
LTESRRFLIDFDERLQLPTAALPGTFQAEKILVTVHGFTGKSEGEG